MENANRFRQSADSVQKRIIENDPIYRELEQADLGKLKKQYEELVEKRDSEKTRLLELMTAFISKSIEAIK